MENRSVLSILLYAVLVLVLSACAGGGGGGDGGGGTGGTGPVTAGGLPSISALELTPTQAVQNSGDGAATVRGAFQFSDAGGDVSGCVVTLLDSSGRQVSSATTTLQGVSGVKTGSTAVTFQIPTGATDVFTVQLSVTDLGGLSSNTLSGTFGIISPTVGGPPWATGTPMPTPRTLLAAGVISGKLYAVGGRGANAIPLGNVECYDPATDTWTTKSPMPTPRSGLAAVVLGNKLYAMGGVGSAGSGFLTTVECYDPSTDTWTTKRSMPLSKCYFAAGVVNGKIYVFGNNTPNAQMYYDPSADTWTVMPAPVFNGTTFATGVISSYLYAAGGYVSEQIVATLYQWDPAANTFTTKAPMPTAREWVTGAVAHGQLYAIGGLTLDTAKTQTFRNEVERYDPATDTWEEKTPMPTARGNAVSGVIDEKIYVLGGDEGTPSSPSNKLEIYDLTADP